MVFPEAPEGILSPGIEIAPALQVKIERIYKRMTEMLSKAIKEDDFLLRSENIQFEINELDKIYKGFCNESLINSDQNFENHGLMIVRSAVIQTDRLLNGLSQCCNFLRSYYPNRSAFRLEEFRDDILEKLDVLSPKFYTLLQVKDAIKRHRANLREARFQTATPALPQALRDIHKNNNLYLLDVLELKEFIDEVLLQHLTDEEYEDIRDFLPQPWKDAIKA
jgi:hypothetical protein